MHARGRVSTTVGILAVCVIWGVSAYANFLAGHALASAPEKAWLLGAASLGSDLLKGVALFFLVAAVARRRYVVATVAGLSLALCAIWSLRSATWFISSELRSYHAEADRQKMLDESALDLVELRKRRAAFLSQQSVTVDVSNKFARKDAIEANAESSAEFQRTVKEIEASLTVLASQKAAVAADPIAEMLGINRDNVAFASAIFFALLLEIVSGAGFWFIAASRSSERHDPPPSLARVPLPPLPAGGNVVRLPVARVDPTERQRWVARAVQELIEPGDANDRIPARMLIEACNARLPAAQRVSGRNDLNGVLIPALLMSPWPVEKRKIGGVVQLCGVRWREPTSQAAAM